MQAIEKRRRILPLIGIGACLAPLLAALGWVGFQAWFAGELARGRRELDGGDAPSARKRRISSRYSGRPACSERSEQ